MDAPGAAGGGAAPVDAHTSAGIPLPTQDRRGAAARRVAARSGRSARHQGAHRHRRPCPPRPSALGAPAIRPGRPARGPSAPTGGPSGAPVSALDTHLQAARSAPHRPIGHPITASNGPLSPLPGAASPPWPAQRLSAAPQAPNSTATPARPAGVVLSAVCAGKRKCPRDPRRPDPHPLSVPAGGGGGEGTKHLRLPPSDPL